jgi:hypothetical protein
MLVKLFMKEEQHMKSLIIVIIIYCFLIQDIKDIIYDKNINKFEKIEEVDDIAMFNNVFAKYLFSLGYIPKISPILVSRKGNSNMRYENLKMYYEELKNIETELYKMYSQYVLSSSIHVIA